jgi:sodium transport system permease protein
MSPALTVFLKELKDAVRDKRSWMVALAISMLSGPILFTVMSNFIAGLEERAAARTDAGQLSRARRRHGEDGAGRL